MSKGTFWKKLAKVILLLGIGILAGMLIGMPIGEQKGRRDAQEVFNSRKQEIQGLTKEVLMTAVPEPTFAPEVTPTREANPTALAQPTIESVVTPLATPTGDVTPTSTVKPIATLTPVVTPKATTTPTPTVKPTKIPTATGENGYYGRLHVEGTYLADTENQLVQLRGISTHGIGWFPQYVNEAAICQINEEWGCNVFRLAMYTTEGAGYCTNGDAQKEKLKELIHTGVTAAIRQDMYVIIDWHVLNDRDPNLYKDEAKKFFAEIAKNYGDDPHVIYEICNEPNSGVSWSQIKNYALEVIPVIREYAPNAVIIVGTPTWSQDVDVAANDPITEYDNIMYALHFYAETHQESLRNKCKTAVAKGLPIFVTEYGICDASGDGIINETQANIWIDFLDSYGISHVAWNLSNKNESSSMLVAGCSKVNGFTESDLSVGGTWFVNMLKAAGSGIGAALSGTTEAGQERESGGSSGENAEGTESSSSGAGKEFDVSRLDKVLKAGDGILYTVSNSWSAGGKTWIQLSVTICNDSSEPLSDWERELTVVEEMAVELDSGCWGAVVTKEENVIRVKPVEYTRSIEAGGSIGNIGVTIIISE